MRALAILVPIVLVAGCGGGAVPLGPDVSPPLDALAADAGSTLDVVADRAPTLDATLDESPLDTGTPDRDVAPLLDAPAPRDVTAVDARADVIAPHDSATTDAGGLPYGPYCSYRPGPTTTGVRAGTRLTPYTNQFGPIVNGALALRTAGVTLDGFDIPAFIAVQASGITIRNCRIHGPPAPLPTGSHNLISAYDTAATNLVVEDCTLAADAPDHNTQGLQGKSFHAARNHVYNVVDGIDPLGNDVTIEANYIHDLVWFSPDTNHSDNHSHNDCIQLEGGTSTIRCNNLEAFLSPTLGQGPTRPYDQANSAILAVSNTTPLTTDLVIAQNWIDGGAVSINIGPGTYSRLGTIDHNVFGDHQYYSPDAIRLNSPRASIGLSITGNTFGPVDRPLATPARNGTTVDTGNGVVGG